MKKANNNSTDDNQASYNHRCDQIRTSHYEPPKSLSSLKPNQAATKSVITTTHKPNKAMISFIRLKFSKLTNKYAISVKNAVKKILRTFLKTIHFPYIG